MQVCACVAHMRTLVCGTADSRESIREVRKTQPAYVVSSLPRTHHLNTIHYIKLPFHRYRFLFVFCRASTREYATCSSKAFFYCWGRGTNDPHVLNPSILLWQTCSSSYTTSTARPYCCSVDSGNKKLLASLRVQVQKRYECHRSVVFSQARGINFVAPPGYGVCFDVTSFLPKCTTNSVGR